MLASVLKRHFRFASLYWQRVQQNYIWRTECKYQNVFKIYLSAAILQLSFFSLSVFNSYVSWCLSWSFCIRYIWENSIFLKNSKKRVFSMLWGRYKDGEAYLENESNKVVLEYVRRDDAGRYSCQGNNMIGWGEKSNEFELIVQCECLAYSL